MIFRNYTKIGAAGILMFTAALLLSAIDSQAWQVTIKNETNFYAEAVVAAGLSARLNDSHYALSIEPKSSVTLKIEEYCPGIVGGAVFMPKGRTDKPWRKALETICTQTGHPAFDWCSATCSDIEVSIIEDTPGDYKIVKR